MEQLKTIRLYGKLGAKFGRVHRLAVDSAAEAVRALSTLLPGFERELLTSKDRGVVYSVFLGKDNIAAEQLRKSCSDRDIRIAPVLAGSKRSGLFQTIVGAVMMVAGTFFGQTWMVQLGASMALGGVLQMISPQQSGLATRDSPDNGASYNFNGPVNTTAQGNCVPLGYGEMIIGSAVISGGIYNQDQV